MKDIASTMEQLNADAEKIRNTDPVDLSTMEIGDEWQQGDVRIIRISKRVFDTLNLRPIDRFDGQVAPGNTQGSRHIISDLTNVKAYRMRTGNELDGPIVEADQPFSVVHPEHGDCVNMPAGYYAFPGQRSFAEELRRAAD